MEEEYLKGFASGPLDRYRTSSTFDWRDFKLKFFEEKDLQYKYKMWKIMEKEPVFAHSVGPLRLEDHRKLTFLRSQALDKNGYGGTTLEALDNLDTTFARHGALVMYDASLLAFHTLKGDFVAVTLICEISFHHHSLLLTKN